MTVKQAVNWALPQLKNKSLSRNLDAEVLLCHVLKKDKAFIYASPDKKLSLHETSKYRNLIFKRSHLWPVAYLTGQKEFFDLDFKVSPDVLIPRPETETLIERALDRITKPESRIKNIIDLGTGSGNIAVSIAKNLPKAKIYALDSSSKALKIAKSNARRHGVSNQIKFLRGNLLSPFLPPKSYKLKANSLILANLPYLTPKQYSANPDLKYEPRSALVGGKDGLSYFRELFKKLSSLFPIRYSLIILLEHDPRQKLALQKLVKKYLAAKNSKGNFGGLSHLAFHKDLTGKYRTLEISIRLT